MALARALQARAGGALPPQRLEAAVAYARASELAEGGDGGVARGARLFARVAGGGGAPAAALLCLQLDATASRFLLATDSRAGVHLFDCARTGGGDGDGGGGGGGGGSSGGCGHLLASTTMAAVAPPPLYSDVALPRSHATAVTGAAWYGPDAGLFLTTGMDGLVMAWDAARFAPAYAWDAGAAAYCVALRAGAGAAGSAAGTLAAVATAEPPVRLLDVRTCAFAQVLLGHTAAVLTVAWLPSHEYVLASGSRDGTMRLWDVRRSGAQALLAVADAAALPSHAARALVGAAAAQHQSLHPSAPSSASAAVAHVGGVNFVLPLDAPALGDAGARCTVQSLALPVSALAGSALRGWRSHLASGGCDRRAQVWDVVLTTAAGAEADVDADVAVSAVPAPAVLPPVHSAGRRCVYPAAARVGPACARAAPRAAGVAVLPAVLPADTVLFLPSCDAGGGGGGGPAALSDLLATPGHILAVDAATGRVLNTLRGHLGPVNALAYRDTAQELYSAGSDGAVLLWKSPLLAHRAVGGGLEDSAQ